jgi:hypothetical protein
MKRISKFRPATSRRLPACQLQVAWWHDTVDPNPRLLQACQPLRIHPASCISQLRSMIERDMRCARAHRPHLLIILGAAIRMAVLPRFTSTAFTRRILRETGFTVTTSNVTASTRPREMFLIFFLSDPCFHCAQLPSSAES